MITKRLTRLALLLIIAFSTVGLTAQDAPSEVSRTKYYYGYFDYLTPDKKVIHLIDPGSLQLSPRQIQLSFEGMVDVSKPHSITGIIPSPNGTHLVITVVDKTIGQQSLFLYRTMTGDLERIGDRVFDDPVWSDNGLYFAYNAYVPMEGFRNAISATYVYSTVLRSSIKIKQTILGLPKVHPMKLTFSPDGVHLAVLNKSCGNDNNCTSMLEYFNIQNGTLILSNESSDAHLWTDYLCLETWSPDSRYLSFVSICEEQGSRFYGELYVWDVVQNEVRQLTVYTSVYADDEAIAKINGSLTRHFARYATVWLNADKMLVSAFVTRFKSGENGNSYPVFDQAVMDVSMYVWPRPVINTLDIGSRGYFDLTLNPTDKTRIAFREERYTPDAVGELLLDPYHAQNAVRVAEFDGEIFHFIYEAEYGCALKWSPDGEWLAYIATDGEETIYNRCPNLRNVNFLNNATGVVMRYPEEPLIGFLDMFGWVALPVDTP